jgi:hypothetical protein
VEDITPTGNPLIFRKTKEVERERWNAAHPDSMFRKDEPGDDRCG